MWFRVGGLSIFFLYSVSLTASIDKLYGEGADLAASIPFCAAWLAWNAKKAARWQTPTTASRFQLSSAAQVTVRRLRRTYKVS